MKKYLLTSWLVIVVATLVACGGSNGSSAPAAVNVNSDAFTSAVLALASNSSDLTDPADINSVPSATMSDTANPVPII